MVFTKSLLIKALGGVAGVSGTTVGVLAGTGVFDRKETNTPPKAPVNPEIPSGAAKPKEGVTSNQVTTGDGTDTNHQDAVTGAETEPSNSRVDGSTADESTLKHESNEDHVDKSPAEVPEKPVNKDAGSPGVVVPPGISSPGNSDVVPGSQDSKGEGNESVDSTNPVVGSEVDNKAGEGATEQQPKQAGQTGDSPQQEDSCLQAGQEDDKGNTQQDSQPGVQTSQNGGGDEDRSASTSQISAPGSSGNPEQGASGSDPKPQPSSTTTPNAEEVQKSPEVNTGVTEPQQSTTTDRTEDNTNGQSGNAISQKENISGGHETQQPGTGARDGHGGEVDSPTNPDSGADSHRAQTSDISQQSNPTPQAGQTGGDNTGSTSQGSPDVPGTGGAPGSTPTNELGTGGGNGASGGGSGSSDISDQATQSQSKEEKINAKLVELGLPNDKCNFSSGSTSTTCSISKDELDKVNFEDSSGSVEKGQITGLVGNVQLKIEILSKSKKTAYGLNDDSEGESDVTKDLLFTLSGFDNEINVGHDSTPLYPNTNPEFKVEGNALKLMWDVTGELSKKAGLKNNNGTYSLGESIKYSENNDEVIKTLNPPSTTGTVHVQGSSKNFNQGEKITFSDKVTSSGGSDSLESGDYEIKYKDGDNGGWYLSKVTQPAGGGQAQ